MNDVRRAHAEIVVRSLVALMLLFVAGARPCPAVERAHGDWVEVQRKDGIVVDRREVAGSSLHEFRGRGVVAAPVTRVLAVLADAPRRPEWMDQCAGSYVIERVNDHEEIEYNRTRAPWPVADRDAVLRGTTVVDPERREVRNDFVSVEHPKAPKVRGVVRIPYLRGHWYLHPSNGGRWTAVEFQVHADPGGRLPDWLANRASKKLPYRTLQSLRAQVHRRGYAAYEAALLAKPAYRALLEASK
jgi:hypothetical protein